MNYIKHLNHWMELVAVDDRLSPHHISIYLALFQLWNKSRFPDRFSICRSEVLAISKIGSSKTYYKCLHALADFGYIRYYPSNNPLKGSVIAMNQLDDLADPGYNKMGSDEELTKQSCQSLRPGKPGFGSLTPTDPCATQLVTPLYKNRLNNLNTKQCVKCAREKKSNGIPSLHKGKYPLDGNTGNSAIQTSTGTCPETSSVQGGSSAPPKQNDVRTAGNFAIPSLDEVKKYFLSMNINGLPDSMTDRPSREQESVKFYHHYESLGWIVAGSIPMCNWKASCHSWMAKTPYFNGLPNKAGTGGRKNFHVDRVKNYAQPL